MNLLTQINDVKESQYLVLNSVDAVDDESPSTIDLDNTIEGASQNFGTNLLNDLGLAVKRRMG